MTTSSTSTYAAWANLLRRSGPKPAWQSFSEFAASLPPDGAPGTHVLHPRDRSQPIGPDNCVWIAREAHYKYLTRARWVQFRGIMLPLSCWAAALGVTPSTLSSTLADCDTQERVTTAMSHLLAIHADTPEAQARVRDRLAVEVGALERAVPRTLWPRTPCNTALLNPLT